MRGALFKYCAPFAHDWAGSNDHGRFGFVAGFGVPSIYKDVKYASKIPHVDDVPCKVRVKLKGFLVLYGFFSGKCTPR